MVNGWFHDHPEMVLGRHAWTSSPYGPTYTYQGRADGSLADALTQALATATAGTRFPVAEAVPQERARAQPRCAGTAADGATIREGFYLLLDGNRLHQVVDGVPVVVRIRSKHSKEGIFDKHARIIMALIPVRDADAVRGVLRAQEANEPWSAEQVRLPTAYHNFTRQFGPINRIVTITRMVEIKPARARTTLSNGDFGEEEDPQIDVDEALTLADAADRDDAAAGEAPQDTVASAEPRLEERETQRRPNLQPFLDDPDV